MKKTNLVMIVLLLCAWLGACTLTVTTDGYVYTGLSGEGYQRR